MTVKWIEGSCLCGEVYYQFHGSLGIFQYCHCSRCRKFTGSAFAANILVEPKNFQWLKGESLIKRFEPKDSKYFATAFCQSCGSSMPWLGKTGKALVVPAGSVDSEIVDGEMLLRPTQNIFCSSQAKWYQAPNELPQYDTLPKKS